MIEKKGIVKPGITPDTEKKLVVGEKQADAAAKTRQLDDDATKRLSDVAASGLAESGS